MYESSAFKWCEVTNMDTIIGKNRWPRLRCSATSSSDGKAEADELEEKLEGYKKGKLGQLVKVLASGCYKDKYGVCCCCCEISLGED